MIAVTGHPGPPVSAGVHGSIGATENSGASYDCDGLRIVTEIPARLNGNGRLAATTGADRLAWMPVTKNVRICPGATGIGPGRVQPGHATVGCATALAPVRPTIHPQTTARGLTLAPRFILATAPSHPLEISSRRPPQPSQTAWMPDSGR